MRYLGYFCALDFRTGCKFEIISNKALVSLCMNQGATNEMGAMLRLTLEFLGEIDGYELVFLAASLP